MVKKRSSDVGNTSSSTGMRNISRYSECQKNHAAHSGGYAVDGCREFMASIGEEALICAACGCHRNFHKREVVQSADWEREW